MKEENNQQVELKSIYFSNFNKNQGFQQATNNISLLRLIIHKNENDDNQLF